MSFTSTMFDDLILELGELATLRDEALRCPEIASSPAVADAVQALSEAVVAMTRAALRDGSAPEVALARIALTRAQRVFGPVSALLARVREAADRPAPYPGSTASPIQRRIERGDPPPWTR